MSALKEKLGAGELLVLPGVFELISATLAAQHNFPGLYLTGNGTVASSLGLPDVGLASYTEMLVRVEAIAQRVSLPLIADGDTGYGGLLNVDRTVRGYERAGAAGIQLEDQQSPKKCGFAVVPDVISLAEMKQKIAVAVEARQSDNFLIVARTDSRRAYGINEALKRAQAFEEAGADVIFIEAPESTEEMKTICRVIEQPKLLNMVDGRSSPVLPKQQIEDLGFDIAIFPCTGFLAATAAMQTSYAHLAATGSSCGLDAPIYPFNDFIQLMGFGQAQAFDERWQSEEAGD
ncbi:carboxyvinyl-carboxyphosphonate phosphorylmutase [Chromatiales bacterium (ex Bugula neritina AB1)]|nr:carboxyvinyl-carboxyphosphonate phosphorylmutase [Chromatiales bacterium (ex Bugula neritina AB1)]